MSRVLDRLRREHARVRPVGRASLRRPEILLAPPGRVNPGSRQSPFNGHEMAFLALAAGLAGWLLANPPLRPAARAVPRPFLPAVSERAAPADIDLPVKAPPAGRPASAPADVLLRPAQP